MVESSLWKGDVVGSSPTALTTYLKEKMMKKELTAAEVARAEDVSSDALLGLFSDLKSNPVLGVLIVGVSALLGSTLLMLGSAIFN